MISFKFFILYKQKHKIENSRRCDICNIDVHTASLAKHLRSKKHLEKLKHDDRIISERLFRESIENLNNIPRRSYNPKPSREIATEIIKIDDKHSNIELAKRMIIPQDFTDRILNIAFNFSLHSHNTNDIISNLTIEPKFSEIEVRLVKRSFEKG